jgi:hypothetical protein
MKNYKFIAIDLIDQNKGFQSMVQLQNTKEVMDWFLCRVVLNGWGDFEINRALKSLSESLSLTQTDFKNLNSDELLRLINEMFYGDRFVFKSKDIKVHRKDSIKHIYDFNGVAAKRHYRFDEVTINRVWKIIQSQIKFT